MLSSLVLFKYQIEPMTFNKVAKKKSIKSVYTLDTIFILFELGGGGSTLPDVRMAKSDFEVDRENILKI